MAKVHWLALNAIPGIGSVTVHKLVHRFGTAEAVFNATDSDLLAVPRVKQEAIKSLRTLSLDALQEEIIDLESEGIDLISFEDGDYPDNLKKIRDAPPVLFIHGSLSKIDKQAVAIVGTRAPSTTALKTAKLLGYELAIRGLSIISGLALGIDTAAHAGALQTESGRTLAVLGSGLRVIHPQQNQKLARKIVNRGALISELSPNTVPRGHQLMARDRIISGLSLAVIVIEADLKSGSLDTALKAKKQSRFLLAVPGSSGTDALLKQGADRIDLNSLDFDQLNQSITNFSIKENTDSQLTLF